MFSRQRQRSICQALRDHNPQFADKCEQWLAQHKNPELPIDVIVERETGLSRTQQLQVIANYCGLGWLAEPPSKLLPTLVLQLSPHLAWHYKILPYADDGCLWLVTGDPWQTPRREELSIIIGQPVDIVLGDPDWVVHKLQQYYPRSKDSLAQLTSSEPAVAAIGDVPLISLPATTGATDTSHFADALLRQSSQRGVTDIHIEPGVSTYCIRSRIDGQLTTQSTLPLSFGRALLARYKWLARLDIAKCHQPQDGRLCCPDSQQTVDIRIATMPTQWGESAVLRLLDAAGRYRHIADLDLPTNLAAKLQQSLQREQGLYLVTGPTSSGKTTTLYALLRQLNTMEQKLLTVEDPVEYDLPGAVQLNVQPDIGVTFAAAMTAFLRHDPDIIMVGEIRDQETAQIAIQAALTGHKVFSTLHTGSVSDTIIRLQHFGIDTFLMDETLQLILVQRLLKAVCSHCVRMVPVPDLLVRLCRQHHIEYDIKTTVAGPSGCLRCQQTGYQGRFAIMEGRFKLGRHALAEKMSIDGQTLIQAGLAAVVAGKTTLQALMSTYDLLAGESGRA